VKIEVTRAFLLAGVRQEVGSSVELADSLARELIATGKAQRAVPAVEKPPGPMTTETAPAVVKGKAAKEIQHAGE
jgi:hypothetical protein